jgi:hypothetical protein
MRTLVNVLPRIVRAALVTQARFGDRGARVRTGAHTEAMRRLVIMR